MEVFIERSCTLPNAIPVKFAKRNAKDQLIAINRGDLIGVVLNGLVGVEEWIGVISRSIPPTLPPIDDLNAFSAPNPSQVGAVGGGGDPRPCQIGGGLGAEPIIVCGWENRAIVKIPDMQERRNVAGVEALKGPIGHLIDD